MLNILSDLLTYTSQGYQYLHHNHCLIIISKVNQSVGMTFMLQIYQNADKYRQKQGQGVSHS